MRLEAKQVSPNHYKILTDGTTIHSMLTKHEAKFIVEAVNNHIRLLAENKQWETNYNNISAEFEEVSAIAQAQAREIEELKKRLIKALSVGGE